jgi:integral membrane protein
MWQTPLGRLRIISLIEGTSFLLLLGFAMPLKYGAGRPEAVQVIGAAHGLLWIMMLVSVGEVWYRRRWPIVRVLAAVMASVLPGGPFVLERSLKREQQQFTPRLETANIGSS